MKKSLLTVSAVVIGVVAALIIYRAVERTSSVYTIRSQSEAIAINAIAALNTAIVTHFMRRGKYPGSLRDLGPQGENLVSSELSQGAILGYEIEYNLATDGKSYGILALSKAGGNNFFSDQTGVVHLGLDASGRVVK